MNIFKKIIKLMSWTTIYERIVTTKEEQTSETNELLSPTPKPNLENIRSSELNEESSIKIV